MARLALLVAARQAKYQRARHALALRRDLPAAEKKRLVTLIEKAERRVLIPVLVQILVLVLVLVLVLDLVTGTRAFAMTQAHAASVIYVYARGLDLTHRDLQFIVCDKGCPCDLGKDVLHPSVVSEVVPMAGHVTNNGALELSINGGNKPKSGIDKIIWNTTQPLRRFVEFLSPATT